MKILALALAVVGCCWAGKSQGQMAPWDLNEVSLLLPLPSGGAEMAMLTPWTGGVGTGQELLPQRIFEVLPVIAIGWPREKIYQALRVVAVRIDPCFQETFASPCQRQVRLVWQPVVRSKDPRERAGWITLDAAIHTFHRLQEAEWLRLVDGLMVVRGNFPLGPGLPLQVHPYLRQEGYRGPFWTSWTQQVLPRIGARNLVRATVMTVNPMGNVWVFLGVDISPSGVSDITIPRIQRDAQAVMTGLDNTTEFRMAINPAPVGTDAFLQFIFDSARMRDEGSEATIQEALRIALEVENPHLQTTGTVDCASCHVSRAVGDWTRRNFPQWNWGRMFPREVFRGPGPLQNTSVNPLRTDILRAFGYFGADPIVSSRVIHDSSVTLGQMPDSVNRVFLRRHGKMIQN